MAVWKEEINFRIETLVAFFVLLFAWYFDFSFAENVAVLVAIFLVLSGEIINTAIEDLCNKIEPNTDMAIAKIKDVMAGFVLLSSLGASILGVFVLVNHFL